MTDRNEELNRIMEMWKEYGAKYNVFVPREQPHPKVWDGPMVAGEHPDKFDPKFVTHWRFFEPTRNFLRQRYAQYGILNTPSLIFDCLVPKFQRPLAISQEKRRQFKLPKKRDPDKWYAKAIEMLITSENEVGFACRSRVCQRTRCKLHRKKRMVGDIYTIIQVFEGLRSPTQVIPIIEAQLAPMHSFTTKGIEEQPKILRYAVPKSEIQGLIRAHGNMRRQHIPKLIEDAEALIVNSELVETTGTRVFSDDFAYFWLQIIEGRVLRLINGPAIRLYLWLLVHQEELARKNLFHMTLTDAEVARSLGISRKTAGIYRKSLQAEGLLMVKGSEWTVRYGSKSQRNT